MSADAEAGAGPDGEWPEEAIDYLQAIADTKLLLGHRYAERMTSGQSIEDDTANMNFAQEEFGHVRQLYALLDERGRDRDWLERGREPVEYANAAPLDEPVREWPAFVVRTALVDRAAWHLLDAVDHPDVEGIARKVAEEEYFHLERGDGWLERLAEEAPETLREELDAALPGTLAFVGPADRDAESDPLYRAGFTGAPVAEVRETVLDHYRELFADAPVPMDDLDTAAPDPDAWDQTRRRAGGGAIAEKTAATIRGDRNREFAVS